jgi:hypothetical protein
MAAYSSPIALRVKVLVRVEAVGAGTGPSGLGGLNADDPSYGQSLSPGAAPLAQTIYYQDAEPVPGTAGSITLANIKTALDAASTTFAGSSGTPIINATQLATINGWFTGSP